MACIGQAVPSLEMSWIGLKQRRLRTRMYGGWHDACNIEFRQEMKARSTQIFVNIL